MSESVIIIGAGIAGLSAGCYARMNGYRAQIFEQHTIPGGLCTSWKRKDYTIDGCIHWLTGAEPGGSFYPVFEQLGMVQGRRMVHHEEFMRIEGPGGKTLIVYTNLDRLQQHLLELAPGDAPVISEFIAAARRLTKYTSPPEPGSDPLGGLQVLFKMLPVMGTFGKYARISVGEFAARFSDPFLRQVFPLMFFGLRDCQVLALLATLAGLHAGDSAYPVGGSLALAQAAERRFLDLGGEVHYRSPVAEVLVEGGKAVGVRLADGSEHRAGAVISAADGHWTIFQALGGRYLDDTIRGYYKLPVYEPFLQVSLGVARDLSHEPQTQYFPLAEPLTIAGRQHDYLGMRHWGYDPTLAPAGKSVVASSFLTDYAYWKELRADRPRYNAEKQRVAEQVIARLDERYPGLAGQVEVVDVATPVTYERYTGNWQGAFMAWKQTPGQGYMEKRKTLPGLRRFYMAGAWVETTGGVCTAAWSGRNVIRLLCKEDGKSFTFSTPSGV